MSGWIKLHRQFISWEWFNKSEAVHLFLYMLLKANHTDGSWQGIKINKGQFITSYNKISSDTGISIQTIRTILKRFELTNEINIQTTNKYTTITICKYDIYQSEESTSNKQLTNKQQATNKQLTTNKNDNNEKNIFIKPSLQEVLQYCIERNNKIDAYQFINFYDSKGWMVGRNKMKDWKACVRTWEKQENLQENKVKSLDQQLYENVMKQMNANK
jgi:hypothetical protein